jgi:5,10-methylenetetrahydromethanopterin reductase
VEFETALSTMIATVSRIQVRAQPTVRLPRDRHTNRIDEPTQEVSSTIMDIALRVPPCRPLAELSEFAQVVEGLGFDRISFPDSQLLWREAWTVMTAAAMSTTRIGLSVSVTNPVTRHASITASAARSVAELAPGRVELSIGAGDSALTHIGARPARHHELAAYLQAVTGLMSGDEVADPVHAWRLHDPVAIPIFVGASGPRNLALGGTYADGAVIPGVAWERDVAIVREAASKVGRNPDALAFTMTSPCVVTDDPERDATIFKPMCVRMAQLGAAPLFAAAGHPVEVPPHTVVDGDMGHPTDWDDAVLTAGQWISDEAALWFARHRCLFGTAREVVEQVRTLEARGVRRLLISHPGAFTLPWDLAEQFATQVLTDLKPISVKVDVGQAS